jgi:hypothetical protein
VKLSLLRTKQWALQAKEEPKTNTEQILDANNSSLSHFSVCSPENSVVIYGFLQPRK